MRGKSGFGDMSIGTLRPDTHSENVQDLCRAPLRQVARAYLVALLETLGANQKDVNVMAEATRHLFAGWGDRALATTGPSPNDITDDGTPLEFSLALRGASWEVRILTETPGSDWSLAETWRAGLSVTRSLEAAIGGDASRFDRVAHLFEPRDRDAAFAMWHAICMRPAHTPAIKVYVDPRSSGLSEAPRLVAEAAGVLGYGRAWARAARVLLAEGATLRFVSFDLAPGATARFKVYGALDGASVDVLAGWATKLLPGQSGATAERLTSLTTPAGESSRPVVVCATFNDLAAARPASLTYYVPVRVHVPNDRAALDRLREVLDPLTFLRIARACSVFSSDPHTTSGALAHFSWRETGAAGALATTTYFGSQLFGAGPISHPPHPSFACNASSTRAA